LAVVIGGTSAEFTLKTVKLASTHYLDDLPTTGTYVLHLGTVHYFLARTSTLCQLTSMSMMGI